MHPRESIANPLGVYSKSIVGTLKPMDPGSSPYRDDGEMQLSQIKDDDDATCSASSEGVFAYVEAKKHCELLSQRSEIPQLLLIWEPS